MKRLVMAAVMRVKPARVGRTVSWRRPGLTIADKRYILSRQGRVAAEIAAELVRLKVDVSSPTQPGDQFSGVHRLARPKATQTVATAQGITVLEGLGAVGLHESPAGSHGMSR
jgi:hypothetical protein